MRRIPTPPRLRLYLWGLNGIPPRSGGGNLA